MNPQSGLVNKNDQNKVGGRFIHNYSSFPDSLSRSRVYTARFGEYTPCFTFDGVEKDQISVNSLDKIDSMSLNSPFKGTIRKIKESFCVPKMAILPMNWDKIYVQPTTGDDVPDDANCVLLDFPNSIQSSFNRMVLSVLGNVNITDMDTLCRYMTAVMRMLTFGEFFYSEGSLLKYCGYSGNAQIEFRSVDPSFDGWYDAVIKQLFTPFIGITVQFGYGDTQYVKQYFGLSGSRPDTFDYDKVNSFRDFLADFRDDPSASIISYTASTDPFDPLAFYNTFKVGHITRSFTFHLPASNPDDDLKDLQPTTLNLSRVLAYQLVCAHFYSNSGVDFLYTADLYRQYVYNLFLAAGYGDDYRTFTYNGMQLKFDYLSGNRLITAITDIPMYYSGLSGRIDSGSPLHLFCVLAAIFGFRRSLRYGDYFVGSRTRPLAPFNSDVSVDNNSVSVIDITKRIQGQRFANAVMRTRSKIENYVKGLFGSAPAPDYHNPFFLAREVETIFGDEVQNTAENQFSRPNSRTSLMASNAGRYTFTFNNDDNHPCIYLQLISFDVRRHYSRSVDRQLLQVNRYDMFNPDFQYIGDQPVYGIELGFSGNGNSDLNGIPVVFGYQGRDMEYKQSFDIALGGAIRQLPGWFFTDRGITKITRPVIDSDFIRSYPSELDSFYLSLTGYSLATYFHFVINTINNIDAKRAMAVDPQILA